MSFLLWTVPMLMGFALAPWVINSFPARRTLVISLLVLAIFDGGLLSYIGIWQALPATLISALWLAVLFIQMVVGLNKAPDAKGAYRPYSGALFILLLVVAIAPIYSAPMEDLPKTDGPYAVGMKEFVVTDPARPGLRGEPADAPRRILVRAYYPADDVTGLLPRPYMTPTEYQAMAAAVASMGQPGFMDSYKQFVVTNTYEDAPISTEGPFPVVLFSHGFTGPMAESLFIVENMASRGHVVFMTSHPGNTRAIVYPDGSTKLIDASITQAMAAAFQQMMSGDAVAYESLDDYWGAKGPYQAASSPMFTDSINIWRDDMIAVADALYDGAIDGDIAAVWQSVDKDKLAYVGMSFGATTAGIACQTDLRCSLAISLDGNNMSPELVNAQTRAPVVSIQAPLGEFPGNANVLNIGIDSVNDLSYEPIAQAGLSGLVTRAVVADTKHLSYTDNASFWRGPVRPTFMVGTLPAAETNAAINGMVGAALDEYFHGQDGAIAAVIEKDPNISTYSLESVRKWAQNKGL